MKAKRTGGRSGGGRGRSASAASSPPSNDLEERLGYSFKNKRLLRRALTHASVNGQASNERLEFLGDRVLGLVAAEKLCALYPDDDEGGLALKINALVRGETCAAAAEAAGVAEHLVLARSESSSGGRRKLAILAGACEALIAAIYMDGGMEAAREFIERFWTTAYAGLDADMRDPKTALQEWAQSRGPKAGPPVYTVTSREGPDHDPRFSVEVRVIGQEPQVGSGRSKRDAEQDAARRMLTSVGKLS
jgi:ribonuclease-3